MRRTLVPLLATALALTACGGAPATPTVTLPEPTRTPVPTETLPPTATPPPTMTAMPEYTPAPVDYTVCARGCDFTSLQAAIDSQRVAAGSVLEVTDAMHTEAGVQVTKDITIRGLGAEATIVQAHETLEGSPERVFSVPQGVTVVIESLTVRHGRPSKEAGHGGGIENYGDLTLRDCVITENSARGGGGVSSRTGSLTVIACTVTGNVARGDGPKGEECGGGGGLKCSSGSMLVLDSTVTNNQAGLKAEGLGGGIRTGCACTAQILNTTVSGNAAVRYGGGIAASGEVRIANCTVTDNTVRSGGGALWIRNVTVVENSLIAGNHGGGDCTFGGEGGLQGTGELGYTRGNFIGDGSCNADLSGDPLLGPLADNGGPTLTHALQPGSAAIDAVPAAYCLLSSDQRGQPRPAGSACDIGAFELGER